MWGIPTGDGGDKFRTTGVRVAVKEYSINLNMYTGDPTDRECATQLGQNKVRPFQNINGHDTYVGQYADQYRAGVFSFGYGNYQIGLNSEKIRHVFQNRFAHDIIQKGAAKWFQVMDKKWHPYFIYKTPTPFTTW